MSDIAANLPVVLLSGGAALAVGLLGLVLLSRLRRRSLAQSLLVVATVPVLALLVGTLVATQVMVFDAHDRTAVLVLVAAAGVVALGAALLLGRRLAAGNQALEDAARAIGAGGTVKVAGAPASRELARLSEELETASARLTEAAARERALEASRRELVSWVSHDLRTPLAGLRAMAEALEDGVAEDPARYHRQMRTEVDRLAGMVDDLFELSRISAGSLRLTLERVSLAELVHEALAGADPLARARGVSLTARAPARVPVRADSAELSRVLTNLVVNAISHTPGDGAVAVSAAAQDGDAVLSVRDECGGIPEHDLDKVFEVAWRGNPARTPHPDRGGGLGLAIARGIVEAHGGRISVANADRGCCFEVRLPLAPGARA